MVMVIYLAEIHTWSWNLVINCRPQALKWICFSFNQTLRMVLMGSKFPLQTTYFLLSIFSCKFDFCLWLLYGPRLKTAFLKKRRKKQIKLFLCPIFPVLVHIRSHEASIRRIRQINQGNVFIFHGNLFFRVL